MARRAKSPKLPKRRVQNLAPLKKHRAPAVLFAALDRAHQATADERVRTLLHELQVHGEEITAQNEQLKKAQAELEHTRDRYADLYDFAPIGYLSLDRYGVIIDINLAGASLIGHKRVFLAGMPLFSSIRPADRATLRTFVQECWSHPNAPAQSIEVETKTSPARILRLTCRAQKSGGEARLFTTVIEVTEERWLELERAAALDRVKALLNRLVTVQEEERRRMARNLHDHLGQQFTALRLTIASLKERHTADEEYARRIERADRLAEAIDKDVDFLAWELRPPALDESGLNAALHQYLQEWSAASGIAAEFHITFPEAVRLPPDVDTQMYRIVQEALQNVRKHSNASTVSVLIEQRDAEVLLIIEDDGRGFDADRMASPMRDGQGMGLMSMQERAALLGGSLQVESTPGEGTSVFVRVPMPPQPSCA
jgi:PAS domain S-box-containing protein